MNQNNVSADQNAPVIFPEPFIWERAANSRPTKKKQLVVCSDEYLVRFLSNIKKYFVWYICKFEKQSMSKKETWPIWKIRNF